MSRGQADLQKEQYRCCQRSRLPFLSSGEFLLSRKGLKFGVELVFGSENRWICSSSQTGKVHRAEITTARKESPFCHEFFERVTTQSHNGQDSPRHHQLTRTLLTHRVPSLGFCDRREGTHSHSDGELLWSVWKIEFLEAG